MNVPQRYQRSRKAGDKQPDSCRYVGRGTGYGNAYKVAKSLSKEHRIENHDRAVRMYKMQMRSWLDKNPAYYDDLLNYEYISCFCPLDMPCHCDAIIEHLKERIKVLA